MHVPDRVAEASNTHRRRRAITRRSDARRAAGPSGKGWPRTGIWPSWQTRSMVDAEPDPMKAGSTLRFRVEDRVRGVESSTWNLVGSKKTGDLYFSGREIMGDLKLSLHESGITRMAWTAVGATTRVADGADRVLSRWTSVDTLPNGWALGRVSIS